MFLNSQYKHAEPESPISKQLSSWKDYYEWRCIPLDSPVALLLQWVCIFYFKSLVESENLYYYFSCSTTV
jgi:hypothetical protein